MREGNEQAATLSRRRNDSQFRRLLDVLPAAAYTCDAEGLITDFNQRAVELWGRQPSLKNTVDRY